jgi:transketolase
MNTAGKYTGMLKALGFQVIEIDGNDVGQVYDAFMKPHEEGKPKAIVGNTVKGKGVSFMEYNNDWHHNRLTDTQLAAALSELEVIP